MITSIANPLERPLPANPTNPDQTAIDNIKRRAIELIGRSYDEQKDSIEDSIGIRHFPPPSLENIHIGDLLDTQSECVSTRIEDAIKVAQSEWGLNLERSGLGIFFSRLSSTTSTSTQTGMICTAMRIKNALCKHIGPFPHIPSNTLPCRIVDKVKIAAGYIVQLKIETTDVNQEKLKKWNIKAGAPITGGIVLGGFLESLQKSETGYDFNRISFNTTGFGGYTPPKFAIASKKDLQTALKTLDQHFIDNFHNISHHQIEIPANGHISSTHAPISSVHTPEITWSPPVPLHQEVDLRELCKNIYALLENENSLETLKSALRGRVDEERVGLQEILNNIKNLDEIFRQILTTPRYENSILVLGKSGVGKSALVSFLLGGDMNKDEHDYLINRLAGPEWPEIGHQGSCTKGASAYESYFLCIDTAGFQDSRGRAFNVVNAAAVSAISRKLASCQLVYMIDGNIFKARDRRLELTKAILTLLEILPQEAPEELWKSVRLVINLNDSLSKSDILERFNAHIEQLESEVNDLYNKNRPRTSMKELPKKFFNSLKSGLSYLFSSESDDDVTSIREFCQWFEKIKADQPSLARVVEEKMRVIEILKKVKERNIMVVPMDMTDLKNRGTIVNFFRDNKGHLSSTSLVMENIVPDWSRQFEQALKNTVSYFSRLFISARNTQIEMQRLRSSIENDEKQRSSLDTKRSLQALKERLKTLRLERQKLDERVRKLKNDLKNIDENPMQEKALSARSPIGGIPSRSWWDWGGRSYLLECDEGQDLPLVRVERAPVTTRDDPVIKQWRGEYAWNGAYSNENKNLMSQGKYSIRYTPCWHGRDESGISITPFVAKKHHPETKTERARLLKELGPTPAKAKPTDTGARMQVAKNQKDQEDCKNHIKFMEKQTRSVKEMGEKLEILNKNIEGNRSLYTTQKQKLEEVLGELICYRPLCQVFVNVIKGLELKEPVFERFIEDLTTFERKFDLCLEEPF